jgi:pyrimidine operon attenuation protein/uracil phosphoribosyltransferase
MGPEDIGRAITRIAHEIRERNEDLDEVVLVGLHSGGDWLAEAIAAAIERIAPGSGVSVGSVDVTMHRDDLAVRQLVEPGRSHVPRDLDGAVVVLVDDVVCTGRTVRAALDAVVDFGRPRMVQLAVLVDRGHREFPIRPDFVGKNLPTHASDVVEASPAGVIVVRGGPGEHRP